MFETSPNLRLPYIMPAQAQKHVTHNEALRTLDALVQISVASRAQAAPPSSPAEGARYILPPDARDSFAGHAHEIAAYQDGAWAFYPAREGWLAWVADEDLLYAFDGNAWIRAAGLGTLNLLPSIGINATADAVNRLAVSSAATLFNHEGSDHRHKINKSSTGDTASLVFQTGYAGRAEIGLAGDDDLHVKVSDDAANWREALVVDQKSGRVRFPATLAADAFASPWRGASWAALGGTLTQQGAYTAVLANLLGARLVNLGRADAHLSVPAAGTGLEIMAQIAAIPADANLVTLEAGAADFQDASPLGGIGDTTPATFYGALSKAILDILTANPRRPLVIITPIAVAAGASPAWPTTNSKGNSFFAFQEAVRTVARRFACPLIDVGGESSLGGAAVASGGGGTGFLDTAAATRMARFIHQRLQFVAPWPASGA